MSRRRESNTMTCFCQCDRILAGGLILIYRHTPTGKKEWPLPLRASPLNKGSALIKPGGGVGGTISRAPGRRRGQNVTQLQKRPGAAVNDPCGDSTGNSRWPSEDTLRRGALILPHTPQPCSLPLRSDISLHFTLTESNPPSNLCRSHMSLIPSDTLTPMTPCLISMSVV